MLCYSSIFCITLADPNTHDVTDNVHEDNSAVITELILL